MVKAQDGSGVEASEYALAFAPGLVVDAADAGNEARFVNDAHGKVPSARATGQRWLGGWAARAGQGVAVSCVRLEGVPGVGSDRFPD